MAIALDTSSQLASDSGGTPTWNHTCTGSNLILLVGTTVATGQTVTGVKYNGVSLTQINTQAIGGATFSNTYLFYLLNPTTGTNSIVITQSGASFCYSAAISYTGVVQASPIDVNNTASATATSVSASVTTTVDNDWLVGFCAAGTSGDTGTMSAGTGMTQRQVNISNWYIMGDSNSALTPIGLKSIAANHSNSVLLGINIAALKPATATAISNYRSLLGVGI